MADAAAEERRYAGFHDDLPRAACRRPFAAFRFAASTKKDDW